MATRARIQPSRVMTPRAPARVSRVSGRSATVLVRAAEKGIAGDGRVKMCNSKDAFEAACNAAGDNLVAVQISTKTCGPCKVVYPHFAKLSEELADVTFCKIMGDHDADTRALMKEWGVRVVPLFMTFRNGEKVEEWSGAKPDVLREKVLAACTDAEKASVVNA
ncbi:uncharacterized protein MICPUCDRAFT_28559 [Micromonas pusilla CCMP1545]|uniref:Predicted protein n=1 Tax=Micromonas pusilla (strain CCMP1545) TaxID=564608 RepID=C1N0H7_MICPC|nr:uncharacterized protein MICPUCDRAFT_28559 [Micromonas pusilla CCMP1545]EEH54272.1 predicted protein [Micromonas pusilla CCMP1545]|eukprot:XP_003061642.1 predicted protein [Micromonas pusilla CCMP1545]